MEYVDVRNFGIALLIGTFIGMEREKQRSGPGQSGVVGIRTLILVSLIGALTAWLSVRTGAPWIFVAGFLGVLAFMVAAHVLEAEVHPGGAGLTSEVGAVAVFLLAGTVMYGYAELGVALAIFTSAILAFKEPIHGLVERIGTEDIYAVLKLLIATFIILPLLPNRTIDPLDSFNPYEVWLLVVFILGISLVGYVAVRLLGEGRGTAVTALAGGLVSSTAITMHFARRSREDGGRSRFQPLYVAGTLLSWAVMFVRVLVTVAVVNPALIGSLFLPVGAMGLVALVFAGFHYRAVPHSSPPAPKDPGELALKNPFSLTSAIRFALLFAVVLVLVALALRYAPGGVYLVSALAGMTDVDAITLTMASNTRQAGGFETAAIAVVIATLANTLVKLGMFVVMGAPSSRRSMIVAMVGIVAAGVVALLFR